jgi:hypothetical protein
LIKRWAAAVDAIKGKTKIDLFLHAQQFNLFIINILHEIFRAIFIKKKVQFVCPW